MMDISEIRKLGEIDGEFAKLLETEGSIPEPATLEQRRQGAHAATIAAYGETPSDMDEYEQVISAKDGHKNTAIVVKRKNASEPGPLVVLYFGGGFVSGEPKQMVPFARPMARLYNAVVVCPGYRYGPEHVFPSAHEDAWSALEWCAHNAATLKADPAKGFLVGGVSAGSNLAAGMTALSVERKLSPKVTGQWLSVTGHFTKDTVPQEYKDKFISREQNTKVAGGGMNTVVLDEMVSLYDPDYTSPPYNPIFTKAPIKDLPPAVFQIDGLDPLRDDGLILHDIYEKAGVPTQIYIYPGQIHAHWYFYPKLKASIKAVVDIMKGAGWLLGSKNVTEEEIMGKLVPPVSAPAVPV